MAKKASKRTHSAKKHSAKKSSKSKASELCNDNDAILKTIFIVLGVAVIVAAYYVGYLVGSGGAGIPDTTVTGGSGTDKLTIVEYADFECPFCQRFYDGAYKQIRQEYGDQVEFEYKHFPLSNIHPNAQKAAEASECARDQGMFWEYHDRLFEQGGLTVPQLKEHASALGLDTAEFNDCLDSGEKASIVEEDMQEAQGRGVRGTPSFWIDGELVVGAQPFEVFQEKIDAVLSGDSGDSGDTAQPSQPSQPSQPTADVSADDDAFLGDADAPVTLIEFTDYECPFCKRHFEQTKGQIVENFVETGKVKYVVRDFPLGMHSQAQKAAEAAECAGEQDAYFAMHDKLFENQESLSVSNYKSWAADLGLDTASFNECLDSGAMEQEVKDDFSDGRAAGVSGTPGFFVNGKQISGAQPYSVFEEAINEALQ